MKKAINFAQFQQIKKMPLNMFNVWATEIYKSGLEDGINQQPEYDAVLSEDDLRDILLSVKGIGEKRAEIIIRRIFDYRRYH